MNSEADDEEAVYRNTKTVALDRVTMRTIELRLEREEHKMTDDKGLDGRHRATVEHIFRHPVSHNIQWHDVLSLLESVATVSEEHDGRYKVRLGSEVQTFDAPRHHDIDEQQVIDLRRMLRGAGITPESA